MNYDDLDIVSIEMAKRLQGIGLRWEPKMGDWFVRLGQTGEVGYLVTHIDYTKSTVHTVSEHGTLYRFWLADTDNKTWLPRRRDLEKALEEMGCEWDETWRRGQPINVYGWWSVGHKTSDFFGQDDTPADAVALAWLQVKGVPSEMG